VYYATIDCGTTNSRAYIVDAAGKVHGKAVKMVGVKDTATSGSSKALEDGVREIIAEAATQAGIKTSDIRLILSSGMITSEIGLAELPHLLAPCGVDELAAHIERVDGLNITDTKVPVYFVRGIKNRFDAGSAAATKVVGELDFMRGEETQIAGILLRSDVQLPFTVVILSSHTKFAPVSSEGKILGSLTTMSGQLYDAVINHTFVSKSVQENEALPTPTDYFDESIVDHAMQWIKNVGLVRSLMFPRFLDVLLDTRWYERRLFLEAMIAAEDIMAIKQYEMFGQPFPTNFILVGAKGRCRLYGHILSRYLDGLNITSITKTEDVDQLSILGILDIAGKAGIIRGEV
jgi:2-dehydro-3-deoxygalactonokinase